MRKLHLIFWKKSMPISLHEALIPVNIGIDRCLHRWYCVQILSNLSFSSYYTYIYSLLFFFAIGFVVGAVPSCILY
jgi:hypothetical protein